MNSSSVIIGKLEEIEKDLIVHGWVIFKSNPSLKLNVNVIADSKVIAEGKANKHIDELAKSQIIDGKYGFEIKLPPNIKAGTLIEVVVKHLDEPIGKEFLLPDFKANKKIKKQKKEELKKLILDSGDFIENFYKNRYKDIENTKLTSIEHFIKYGLTENRDPNEDFDSRFYQEYYQDIQNSEKINILNIGEMRMNPFLHYIHYGKEEGRFKNEKEKLKKDLLNQKSEKEKLQKDLLNQKSEKEKLQKIIKILQLEKKDLQNEGEYKVSLFENSIREKDMIIRVIKSKYNHLEVIYKILENIYIEMNETIFWKFINLFKGNKIYDERKK